MSFVDVENLRFSYDGNQLYNDTSFKLFDFEHAVLVGPNGCGKSTLLKLIAKKISPDKGSVIIRPNVRVGYLDQYQDVGQSESISKYIYDVFSDLYDMEKKMINIYEQITDLTSNYEELLRDAQNISDYLEKANFYQITSQISNILNGLGLPHDILDKTFAYLSGGMKAKVILAKLLLQESDLLLLDEPTNFLDVVQVEWLIKFLNQYKKAFIVVSHDEGFIREIAQTVIQINNQEIFKYKGNYDFYLKEKEIRQQNQIKAYESQQKKIVATQQFIDKNITRASTTKRAQSRRKMLNKLNIISKPKNDVFYNIEFKYGYPTGKDVLVTHNLLIGYDEPLVEPLNIHILKGEKVVFTGKNGIGKSTLIKTLTNNIESLGGSFEWLDTVKYAYLPQISNFNDTDTAFILVINLYPNLDNKQIYRLLASYGIDYEKANRPLKTLSGGEQTKVMLALLKDQMSNVLILDEPTNHLDINFKTALQEAIKKYEGTLLLVSHEKEFYEGLCDYEIELFS